MGRMEEKQGAGHAAPQVACETQRREVPCGWRSEDRDQAEGGRDQGGGSRGKKDSISETRS